ncbi:MAG: gliding motility-associated C-terminal domain-containing protein [Bacteroidales bacterium]|jgi:gliding motility-associated-like protein|nr:gliding motility-associated C-terminal domain-containing protein [Bacteroidales bacterium]
MKEINDIFKDKLYNYQKTPSQEIFDNIKKNYPKTSFKELCRANIAKIVIYIILIISTIILIIVILNYKNENQIENTNNVVENNNNVVITNISKNNTKIIQNANNTKKEIISINKKTDNWLHQNKDSKTLIQNINFFTIKDTIVCGLEFEMKFIEPIKNIILPKGIEMSSNSKNTIFVASNTGEFLIKYYEKQNNVILIDSMTVVYTETAKPKLIFSDEILCPNQSVKVTIENLKNYSIDWEIENLKIKNISKNKFEIFNLKNGENLIKINYSNKNCNLTEERIIKVFDNIIYNIQRNPDYCSGGNGAITINVKNLKPELFVLDNKISNKTGYFPNLNAGIHFVQIKYNNECVVRDSVFLFDTLKLKPYFKVEADLIDKNRFLFNNLTEIDYLGYEKNHEIEFIWKINDKEISRNDNFDYEFPNGGNYNVKLLAKINNDCFREYSENLVIADTYLKIPNVFTPNGDGVGDFFEIKSDIVLKNFSLIISGTQGEKVFESNNANNFWDGKISGNNDAPEGVYYYTISAEGNNGKKIKQAGTVQLIRR